MSLHPFICCCVLIKAHGTVYSLDVSQLSEQLGYQIDSVSWGDTLLYADFLPQQKKLRKMSVRNLVLLALRTMQNEEKQESKASTTHSAETKLKELFKNEEFILLDVSVQARDDAKGEGNGEVRIPKIKVYVHASPKN